MLKTLCWNGTLKSMMFKSNFGLELLLIQEIKAQDCELFLIWYIYIINREDLIKKIVKATWPDIHHVILEFLKLRKDESQGNVILGEIWV